MRVKGVAILALALGVGAPPATASMTIGQTDPAPTPMASCAGVNPQDMAQPTVTSGNSYVVPPAIQQGTITAWSHNAYTDMNQHVTMKVWRLINGTTYRVVGRSDRGLFNGPGLITFGGISVPVHAGDVLGLNSGTGAFVDCMWQAIGDTMLYANPSDTPEGQDTTFGTVPDRRPNISAVVEPTNTFTAGAVTRNKKKGTATIAITVPNPGELTASGNGVKASAAAVLSKPVLGPGTTTLLVKAQGKKKRRLKAKGKVKVALSVSYTPTAGASRTEAVKIKLIKKR